MEKILAGRGALVDAGAQARTAGLTLWLLTGGLDGMAAVPADARKP
jgi:hypothetical protein